MKSAEMMLIKGFFITTPITLSGKKSVFIYDTLELKIAVKANFIIPNN